MPAEMNGSIADDIAAGCEMIESIGNGIAAGCEMIESIADDIAAGCSVHASKRSMVIVYYIEDDSVLRVE
jgi:hypothetical protein